MPLLSMTISNDSATYSQETASSFLPIIQEVMIYVQKYVQPIAVVLIGSFGIVANILSICVFVKQGIKDCMSVCLISLGVTDFASVATAFMAECIRHSVDPDFDPIAVHYVLIRASGMFYHASTLTTALLSLERCLCVTWPFKFKSFFTFHTAIIIVALLYVLVLCTALPEFLTCELIRLHDLRTNSTKTVLRFTSHRLQAEAFIKYFATYTVEPLCLIVVLISVYFMIIDLKRSSQLQGRHTQQNQAQCSLSNQLPVRSISAVVRTDTRSNRRKTSSRNRRVEQIILILAVLCFVCNSLRLVALSVIFEYLGVATLKYETTLLIGATFFLQTTNASINFVVYYVLNTTFKGTIKKMFCVFQGTEKTDEEAKKGRSDF